MAGEPVPVAGGGGSEDDGDPTVYVLNVIWFAPGGAELYARYLEATRPLVEAMGGAFLEPFQVVDALEGGLDADLVFYGRYPSREALWGMLASDEYQEAYRLREQAVARSITSLCRPANLPPVDGAASPPGADPG
jgi:uncharacterized protein (DUF1330 family)